MTVPDNPSLPTPPNLARCQFGIIQTLDELFEGFVYCKQASSPGQGTWSIKPDGWCFISYDRQAPIVTFPPGHRHPGPCLYTKPKAAVLDHMWTRAMTDNVTFSFSIETFRPGEPWTLITGTDSTMIPTVYLAYIATAELPVIDSTNTKIWTPGEPHA